MDPLKSWENTPNISFRFCAENDKASTKQDCYEFTFGSAGIRLRRVLSKSTPASLFNINRKPHEIDNQEIEIDLRIDRELGKITLFLDGKERGSWIDPFDSPQGNHIILSNRSSQGPGCKIANLTISQWKDGSQPKHLNNLVQGKDDVLINDEDNRRSGHIISISKDTPKKQTVQIKGNYAKKPLIVPTRRVNTLIFAQPEQENKEAPSPYHAQMVGGGTLQLENPQLNQGKITTTHPILGPCVIDTSAVSRIVVKKK